MPSLPPHSDTPDLAFVTLRSFARQHRWLLIAVNAGRVLAAALLAIHPYFLANFVTSHDDKDAALRYLLLLLASGTLHFLIWSATDFAVSRWVNPLSHEFKRLSFSAYWKNDYAVFVDHPSGKVGSYVNDIQRHSLVLWDSFHYGFLPMVTALPVYAVLLFDVSWRTSLGYGLFLVIAGLLMTRISKSVRATQHVLTDTVATNNGRVFDSYANFVNVFSFRGQPKEIARNDGDIAETKQREVAASYALSRYWTLASFLIRVVLWTFVILYNWYLFEQGTITFDALVISITVLLAFTEQYWQVVHQLGVWVDSAAAYRAAYNYLFPGQNIIEDLPGDDVAISSVAVPSVKSRPRLESALELRGVSFAYPDRPDEFVLQDIDLRVAKGEKVGVVGRSGEGKSTLVKILLGFYQPSVGELAIDGTPTDLNQLRGVTAYVPQDTSLFQESVAYNIAYASDHATTLADIKDAARKAHIDTFIESLPEGYETMVGERGIKLSLGQRQRIAIARAFLKPSDLLILDEATSALDSETEHLIQESLEELLVGKAAIVIAHRLATLNSMDRIIVIDGGKIVEQGTKQELLNSGGMFAELWAMQRSSGD